METDSVGLPEGYQLDQPGLPEGYTLDEGPSALGAASRGALDAVPFGTKGAAAIESTVKGGKYADYLKELDNMLTQDKEQQPVAHTVGEIGGSIAPFAIPGVGEALGAESLAGRAGIGAGLGALQAASNTRKDLTSKEGLEDVAMGAGSGALLNPALGGIGDMIAGKAAAASPGLEEIANSKAVQAGNFDPNTLGLSHDELQEMGQNLRDLDLVQGSTPERHAKAQDLLKQVGAQIGEIGQDALPVNYGSGYLKQFTDPLQEKADSSAQIFGPDSTHDVGVYRQAIANIQHIPANSPTFDALQNLKSQYGERAFDAAGGIKDQAYADSYHAIKNAMKSIINDSPDEYQGLMTAYGSLKDITRGLTKQLQKEQAGGTQVKGFGMAGKLGGMILGGNVPATVGTAAALAPVHPFMAAGVASSLLTNPQLMSKAAGGASEALSNLGTSGIAKAAPGATNSIENMLNHPAMASYKPMFQQAAQGLKEPEEIQKKNTITDFVLSQRDPNYSSAKEKASEDFK